MKRLNCTRFALLLILVLGLGACGDDVYYTDDYLRNSDEKLCGKTWTEMSRRSIGLIPRSWSIWNPFL